MIILKRDSKADFVAALGAALRDHSREEIFGLTYDKDPDGFEAVTILYTNGCTRTVNVTGDSCIAIMQDVAKAIL
jgi:hypothetical protein